MEKLLERLKALKKERAEFFEKYKDDPNIGICYSARWMEKDDINREIDRTLRMYFEIL